MTTNATEPTLQLKDESLWKIAREFTDQTKELTETDYEQIRERLFNKADNIYLFRLAIEAEIRFHEDQEQRHASAKIDFQNLLESFDKRVASTMKYFQFEKIPGNEYEISFGRLNTRAVAPSSAPTEQDLLDPNKSPFIRVTTPKPKLEWDKTKIKEAVDSEKGCSLIGAAVEKYRNLVFDVRRRIEK